MAVGVCRTCVRSSAISCPLLIVLQGSPVMGISTNNGHQGHRYAIWWIVSAIDCALYSEFKSSFSKGIKGTNTTILENWLQCLVCILNSKNFSLRSPLQLIMRTEKWNRPKIGISYTTVWRWEQLAKKGAVFSTEDASNEKRHSQNALGMGASASIGPWKTGLKSSFRMSPASLSSGRVVLNVQDGCALDTSCQRDDRHGRHGLHGFPSHWIQLPWNVFTDEIDDLQAVHQKCGDRDRKSARTFSFPGLWIMWKS